MKRICGSWLLAAVAAVLTAAAAGASTYDNPTALSLPSGNGPMDDFLAANVGTAGPDVLSGTPGPDIMLGLGGKDRILGLAGNDVICGGLGNDQVLGAPARTCCAAKVAATGSRDSAARTPVSAAPSPIRPRPARS